MAIRPSAQSARPSLALLLAVLPACGGSATSDPPSVSQLVQPYCSQDKDRTQTCFPKVTPEDSSTCEKETTCWLEAYIRADRWGALLDCLAARPCNKKDDSCFTEVGSAASAAGQAYLTSCTAKLAACPADSFSDDYCTAGDVPWPLFSDEYYQALTTCFSTERPCNEVTPCLKEATNAKKSSSSKCS